MNLQAMVNETNAEITATVGNGKVYVRLGHDTALFLSIAEAVDLVDAVATVLAEIESPAMQIPL